MKNHLASSCRLAVTAWISLITPAFAVITTTDTFGIGGNTFMMNFATIGNAGNENDDTGYGSVGYTFRIGVNEVSRAMIDIYNSLSGGPVLTMSDMALAGGNGANRPAAGISWNEAAWFVNWLNTSEGYSVAYKFTTGDTNDDIVLWTSLDAGYDAANPFRNINAHYFLPSEDEWYKAAYYDPSKSGGGGYWNYATGSDSAPLAVSSGTTTGTAIYNGQFGPANITNAGGLGPYGTMSQNGNMLEWCESAFDLVNDTAGELRVQRGGSWSTSSGGLLSTYRIPQPDARVSPQGFRVAAVPEPSACFLSLLGMLGFVFKRKR
jgi:formylglycine-generating enzyme